MNTPDWSLAFKLLGTTTDYSISKQTGIPYHRIQAARRKRGIGLPATPANSQIQWTPKKDALLGTKPDDRVARLLFTTASRVRRRREELGIPRAVPAPQPPSRLTDPSLLGTMPDRDLAARTGLSQRTIANYRRRAGIRSFDQKP